MEHAELPFAQSVSEADIDWILCLELNVDPSFRSWFGNLIFGFEPVHRRAWRSISDLSLGESDIVWLVSTPDGTARMALIENKIDAPAQPEQYERYFKRAEQYREQGHCAESCVVLISPADYKSVDSHHYGLCVSYESIKGHFDSCGDERGSYLSSVFQTALSHPVRPPDPDISAFRRQVWQLAHDEFPQIALPEPQAGREYWVSRNYDGVLIRYKMYAKNGVFQQTVVDLELPGRSADVQKLRNTHAADLKQMGASVVQAGKSAAVRIEVPCAQPPEFQESLTRPALEAWAKLLEWWQRSREVAVGAAVQQSPSE